MDSSFGDWEQQIEAKGNMSCILAPKDKTWFRSSQAGSAFHTERRALTVDGVTRVRMPYNQAPCTRAAFGLHREHLARGGGRLAQRTTRRYL